jgi:DNA modification methylase
VRWKDKRDYSIQVWQRYASPVWFDISQTNVLNYQLARDGEDEKHICPLQLDVIERAIELWTNPGDIVFSPFSGIGSEPYSAVKLGRRGVGIELKESYFNLAVRYLQDIELASGQKDLFSTAGIQVEELAG